jgi:hypothetical protein
VWHTFDARFIANIEHGFHGSITRAATGTEGHREKTRLQFRQSFLGHLQLTHGLRRAWREKLETEGGFVFLLGFHNLVTRKW